MEERGDIRDASFISPFEDVEYNLLTCTTVIDSEEMAYMYAYENEYGNTIVEFEVLETGEYYVYMFNNEVGNGVEVTYVGYDEDGEVYEEITYWFTEFNNEDFEIVAPL